MTAGRPSFPRSVLISVIGSSFPPIASLVTAPVLARGLGVIDRGEVGAAQAVTLLAVSITAFGLPEAVTYFVARRTTFPRAIVVQISAFTVAVGLAATAVIWVLANWLGGGSESAEQLIRFAAISVTPALILGLIRAHAAGLERWGRVAAERIIGSGLRMIGAIGLFSLDLLNPVSATILIVATPLIGGVAYLVSPTVGKSASKGETLRRGDAASYGLRVWIGAVSGILLMRIDQSLLIPLSGPEALGLYTVAVAISEVPLVLNWAIRDVAFSRQSSNLDPSKLAMTARISLLATAACAAGVAAVLPLALPALFGQDFRDAVEVTWILLLAVAIGTPGSIAGAGLGALGRPGLRSLSLTIAVAINIAALILLAPRFGATGGAVATLIGNLVSSNLNILWLSRRTSTPWRAYYQLRSEDVRVVVRAIKQLRNRGDVLRGGR